MQMQGGKVNNVGSNGIGREPKQGLFKRNGMAADIFKWQ